MELRQRRDLDAARTAYDKTDVDAAEAKADSIRAHSLRNPESDAAGAQNAIDESGHNVEHKSRATSLWLQGSHDGVLLALATIELLRDCDESLALRTAAALVAVWAVLSAAREYLEMVVYAAYYTRERRREAWEMNNYPKGEIDEMVQLYVSKGLPRERATAAVAELAKSPDFFVDVMMLEELNMKPPAPLDPLAAGVRVGLGVFGAGLPVAMTSKLLGAVLLPTALSLAPTVVAAAILAAVGAVRAAVTHRGTRRLSLQSALAAPLCLALTSAASSKLPLCSSP